MALLTTLVLPSGVALLLLLTGLLLARWQRLRRLSWGLLAASGLVALAFSSGMTAAALMSPLEYAYPALRDPRAYPQARHIVVLTGWAADDPLMPLTGRLNVSAAYRVLMTLELYADRPDCNVVISGGRKTARIMMEALHKLGVPQEKLVLEGQGDSTAESAALLKQVVAADQFFLVTSAGHLPRSMEAMSRHALHAIPVPTEHQLPRDWRHADWQPTPGSLVVSDLAVHEHAARLWERMRGPGS